MTDLHALATRLVADYLPEPQTRDPQLVDNCAKWLERENITDYEQGVLILAERLLWCPKIWRGQ